MFALGTRRYRRRRRRHLVIPVEDHRASEPREIAAENNSEFCLSVRERERV
jgi:hypothetical protein